MTKRGEGERSLRIAKEAGREEPKQHKSTIKRKTRLLVWSAPPVSMLMWVYVLSVVNEGVGTAEISKC